ncbi:uncharacterized protein LOC129577357 isoform X2 [Sitodiplosis mosellana]|uniref:uncharacterized protein LOC129577357 isoform X2 n=1 Tax=Sitodiplosis mosellana TaxID=263140 RepID=UPI002444B73C|nr:uncharacterized protein LOC129577357 isoform X2 [Sitodiplosis mosellana]
MTNTRHGKIQTTTTATAAQITTTPYPRFITIITTRIIHAIASNDGGTTSPNDKHDNYDEHDGGVLKSKCKTPFSRHFTRILIVILISFTFADMVHAGTCWAKRTQGGKCKHPMERNVSREKCCGGGDDVGFTEKEMTEFEYFFATALGDGTACGSCIDSCKTAKCGAHKKCVMRSGQPKCVCAPKCKTKNQRPKRNGGGNHHAHSQFNSNYQGLNHHHHHHHQSSIDDNDDTSHDDVQIINNDLNNTNRSHTKSDKIISIIAPIHHPSNLSSSHRSKKIHNTEQMHNDKGGGTVSNNSSRQNMVKSSKHLVASSNSNSTARQHHQSGISHRHKMRTHKNEYSNSSLIDNNIVNVNHRRQTSVEQQFKSNFYGHDIPYPPIDLPLYDNNQFHRAATAVCGTDGRTYKTECQLRRRACRQESTTLSLAYKGQCQKSANCDTVRCKDRQVCLNDLVTHRPRCVACSFKCPRRKRPQGQQSAFIKICGMNNKSYHSWCHMMRDSCNTGYYIDVKHNGVCQNSTNT